MTSKITFNELRKIKDSLPDGSIKKLAHEFSVSEETVRNYFGGANYTDGKAVGIHMEPGPDGGIVLLPVFRGGGLIVGCQYHRKGAGRICGYIPGVGDESVVQA